mgnify:CR=1 FL=1
MARKKDPEESRIPRRRLASVSARVKDVSPGAFLRLGPEAPRGFWAREGRWFAHLGAVGVVDVTDPGEGGNRFQLVWTEALSQLEEQAPDLESEVPPPPPRFFGGFAFRDGHLPGEAWAGFPAAHFILPEVELMGREGKGTLTCRGALGPDEDLEACRRRLQEPVSYTHLTLPTKRIV